MSEVAVEIGDVYRLHATKERQNKYAQGEILEHTEFIWIHQLGGRHKKYGSYRRKVTAVFCLVPVPVSRKKQVLVWRRKVDRDYIVKKLSSGFDMVCRDLGFHYEDKNYRQFYRLIGVL